jgi:Hint domain
VSVVDPLPVAVDLPLTGVSGDTPIRTVCGYRNACNMRTGDLCITRDSGPQPVRLVVPMSLSAAAWRSAEAAAVRIAPRAIGPMMPSAAAVLAPDQQIMLPGYLIGAEIEGPGALLAARALGGTSDAIWRDRSYDERPFYALAFDRHELVSAAGLWIASYRPVAALLGKMDGELRERLLQRYPQLGERRDPFPPLAYAAVPPEAYLPSPH